MDVVVELVVLCDVVWFVFFWVVCWSMGGVLVFGCLVGDVLDDWLVNWVVIVCDVWVGWIVGCV